MGVPPIHTPSHVLAALPEDVKKKLYIVHAAKKDVPLNMGLKVAKPGLENTIRLKVL